MRWLHNWSCSEFVYISYCLHDWQGAWLIEFQHVWSWHPWCMPTSWATVGIQGNIFTLALFTCSLSLRGPSGPEYRGGLKITPWHLKLEISKVTLSKHIPFIILIIPIGAYINVNWIIGISEPKIIDLDSNTYYVIYSYDFILTSSFEKAVLNMDSLSKDQVRY